MTKVLIVDDEQKNLYLLQMLLSPNGYELTSASNGAEALDLAHKEVPDVIISDILMPVMDGFSFCRACKADEQLKNIPFIFYTATYTDPKDEDLAFRLGAERFIIKPTEPSLFLEMLKETVNKYTAKEVVARQGFLDEEKYLEEYSSALIRKLEDKVAELEKKNREAERDKEVIIESERLLKESEERFRNAFDYAPIGKVLVSVEGHIIKVNLAFIMLLGYTEDELLKMRAQDITHPDDIEPQIVLQQKMLAGELDKFQIEKRYIHKNGQVLNILLYMSLVRDQSGRPLYFIAQVQDITESKRAEGEIRHQIARAEALVRTSSSINSDLDLKTVLSSICEETSHALGIPAVALHLYSRENNNFLAIADYGLPEIFRESYDIVDLNDYPPEYSVIEKSPIILQDVQQIDNIPKFDALRSLGIRTVVFTRLEHKGKIIGLLTLCSINKVRQINNQDIELIKGLSNQAAQAIMNSRLFEDTKWQLRNIEALHTIDNAIASSMDIQLTLMIVAEKTISQLKVDATNILLFNPASNLLESKTSLGFLSDEMYKKTIHLGEGLAGQIALNWEPIFIANIAEYKSRISRMETFAREGFVSYCGVPLRAKGQFLGVLEVFKRTKLNPDQDWFDFIETLAGQAAIAIDSIKAYEDLQISNKQLMLAYDATIEGWSRAMDLRDKETEGHTQRVTQLSIQMARLFGINEEQIVHFRRGALLHDMGKLGIPDRILLKSDQLTDEEWVIMRKHPQFAYDMLYPIFYLRPAVEIPYCHHEKWDGSGYPRGLKGEEIPLSARIFAVIDVWDALTSDRPYRKAWTREKAIEYIQEQSGKHFDPQVVDVFLVNLDLL